MIETIVNEKYGYRELKDKPGTFNFYQDEYYDLKLIKPTEKEIADNDWHYRTDYNDIAIELTQAGCINILEAGCGLGNLGAFLQANGFDYVGIEPSKKAAMKAELKGLMVNNIDINNYQPQCKFDAVIMINVLEHVLEPEGFLNKVKSFIKPGGVLVCQVPNDFNVLQLATRKEPWWIVSPDHINYFNRKSLHNLLHACEFSVYSEQSDYPMELFILQRKDYIEAPELGEHCHQERVKLEVNNVFRRPMYRHFAKAGIGRNLLTFSHYESGGK